jgi:hypothetical protein
MNGLNFKRFDFKRKPVTEAKASPATTRTLALISQADIYLEQPLAKKKVLIMKKGMTVSPHAIPSLLRFGVKPEQFTLQEVEISQSQALEWEVDWGKALSKNMAVQPGSLPEKGASEQNKATPSVLLNPLSLAKPEPWEASISPFSQHFSSRPHVAPPHKTTADNNKVIEHVVIFDPNLRSLKRSIGCFEGAGIPSQFIHPVPLLENVLFVIKKYQPTWILLDFHPLVAADVLQIIQQVQEESFPKPLLESIFLTVDLPVQKRDDEVLKNQLARQLESLITIPLFKPITRFEVMPHLGITTTSRSA